MLSLESARRHDIRAVEQFLFAEARLLDERRFEEWAELFTEDGAYWAPTRHDQKSPEEAVSLFFDDRVTMAARVKRLRHPDVHIQIPISRTTHLVTNIEIDPVPPDDADMRVFAAFMVAEYRENAEPRWYAGRYEYRLKSFGAGFRIALKKATLVNCDGAFTSMAVYI